MSPLFFENLLIFWHAKMSQTNLALSLPQAWNQLLFQGVLVPFSGGWYLETNIWVWMCSLLLGSHCFWAFSAKGPGKYMYFYLALSSYIIHIHTHKYMYMDMDIIHKYTHADIHIYMYIICVICSYENISTSYAYFHIHTHTGRQTCIYLFLYLCIQIRSWFWYLSFHSISTVFILAFPLTIFVTPFSDNEKPGSCDPLCIYFTQSQNTH